MEYTSRQTPNVARLLRFLEYELSSSVLLFLIFFVPFAGLLFTAAAAVFTVFMLYVLYQEHRHGWLLSFVLCVLAPVIALNAIDLHTPFAAVFRMLPFAVFLLYCFFLRLAIRDWDD